MEKSQERLAVYVKRTLALDVFSRKYAKYAEMFGTVIFSKYNGRMLPKAQTAFLYNTNGHLWMNE